MRGNIASKLFTRYSVVARASLTLLTGSVLGQGLIAGSSIILTRLYLPEEFGRFALFMAFANVGSTVAAGRMDFALLVPADDRQKFSIIRAGLVLSLTAALAGTCMAWGVSAAVDGGLSLHLIAVPLGAGVLGAWSIVNKASAIEGEFARLAKADVIFAGVSVAFQTIGGAMGFSLSLVIGFILGRAVSVLYLGRPIVLEMRQSKYLLIPVRTTIGMFRRFVFVSIPSSLLSQLNAQLPAFLLYPLFGPTVVGYYSLARRVLGAPLTTVGQAVTQVFIHRVASAAKSDRASRKLLVRTYVVLLLLIAPVAVTIWAWADEIFVIAFGRVWEPAGAIAVALLPYIVLKFVVTPSTTIMQASERQGQLLVWTIGNTLAILGVLLAAKNLSWSSESVVWAYSWTSAVLYAIFIRLAIPFRRETI